MSGDFNKYDTPILAKWGPDIALGGYGSGWTAIPSALIRNIGELKLSGTDFAVLSVVLTYWWEHDKLPSPRVGGIARMLNVTPRTVERSLKRMSEMGLIKRGRAYSTKTGLRRDIDLAPLVSRVSELATHDLNFIAQVHRQLEKERQQEIAEEFDDLDDEPF